MICCPNGFHDFTKNNLFIPNILFNITDIYFTNGQLRFIQTARWWWEIVNKWDIDGILTSLLMSLHWPDAIQRRAGSWLGFFVNWGFLYQMFCVRWRWRWEIIFFKYDLFEDRLFPPKPTYLKHCKILWDQIHYGSFNFLPAAKTWNISVYDTSSSSFVLFTSVVPAQNFIY